MAASQSPAALDAESRRVDGFLPIEDYGVIGDGRTVVLVGIDGSIDWMCLPEIDSPSVFGALLDPADGGSFSLAPSIPFEATRAYLPQTNVLQTEFTTAEGTIRVTEAMTIDTSQKAPWRELVRRVEGVGGRVPVEWRLRPRFDYGRHGPEPERFGDLLVYRHAGLQLGLKGWEIGEVAVRDAVAAGSFTIEPGQSAILSLHAGGGAGLPSPTRDDIERRLDATIRLWRDWVARATYEGPFKEAVERSLLAIRLLADGRTGAITAAGTTSLPEVLGGERNYDYRFGWVRDLSYTVDALLRVGMEELAHASVGWLLGSVANTRPRVDPVYALNEDVVRSQSKLPMSGYRGTGPVHVGNSAGSQLQLGGFGDLIETLGRYVDSGHVLAPETGQRIADSLNLLAAIWGNEDAGLWELGDYAHYTTSKISCWTAFDRGLELAAKRQLPDRHVDRWRRERDALRDYVETRLWSESKRSYVMKQGSEMLDCGVLLSSRRGFVDRCGDRINGTIDAIKAELHAEGPLYYRYSGMEEEENAFLACSFWLAEALSLAKRTDEAGALLEELVPLGGPLGLFTEEMEPDTRAMRGNFA